MLLEREKRPGRLEEMKAQDMMLEQVLDLHESLAALAAMMFGDAGREPQTADAREAPAPAGPADKIPSAA
ncbi:hypothetical protein [Aureimonas leprariae]|uniref:Uncharacterized protein n=1 Tax=Plantimonas leprariae TaxID=2615207 RepID=A0A7V7TV42_9HYPH|nr:hypothetical protein [Aureimonas leprariae]KAB0677180.1 hypothetical protein F6X38_18825 [Aureimonas leprariae]